MVAPVPAHISKLPCRKLSCPTRRSGPNSCRLILLQTLLHSQSRQPLWNQVNPNSFAKTPGVGVSRFPSQPPTAHSPLTTFRMNTCKSVSKQSTLTTFRMNTYEKQGEGWGSPGASLQSPAGWPSARRWPSKKLRQAIRASAAVLTFARDGRFASTDAGASSLQRRTPSHPQGFWLASR
jgi:hypothetical protein